MGVMFFRKSDGSPFTDDCVNGLSETIYGCLKAYREVIKFPGNTVVAIAEEDSPTLTMISNYLKCADTPFVETDYK